MANRIGLRVPLRTNGSSINNCRSVFTPIKARIQTSVLCSGSARRMATACLVSHSGTTAGSHFGHLRLRDSRFATIDLKVNPLCDVSLCSKRVSMRRQLRAWHLDQGGINSFRSHIEKPAQPFRQRNGIAENALTDDVLSRQPPNLRSKTRLQGSRPARAGAIRRMVLRQLVGIPIVRAGQMPETADCRLLPRSLARFRPRAHHRTEAANPPGPPTCKAHSYRLTRPTLGYYKRVLITPNDAGKSI